MTVKTLIIEDEQPARKTLRSYLNRYFPQIEVIGMAGSITEAYELIMIGGFDFIFLDIHLKDGNGINFIQQFPNQKFRIIFTTAYDNYAIEAFRQRAFGYLLKPIDPIDFKEIVNRVLKDILLTNTANYKLKIPVPNGFSLIDASDIIRCEAESNYSNIIVRNGKNYIVSKTLKMLGKELEASDKFIRVHQSHLVNIEFIDAQNMRSNSILLVNGDLIPVSRARKDDLLLRMTRKG